jgi:hypothetical protein
LVENFFPAGWSTERGKQVVHIDNAPAHNSSITQNLFRNNPLKKPPRPLYSPNISRSDICLFGKAKSALIGREIPDEIDPRRAITVILNGISDVDSTASFEIGFTMLNG